jgi:hypothetical protein
MSRRMRVRTGAGRNEIELDAGKQMLERAAAACKKQMRMSRLRRPWARRGPVRQCVAVEHNDLFEMGRDGFRRGEASHSGANDDRLPQNRIGHALVSRRTRCRPGQSPVDRTVSRVSERRYRRISGIGYCVTSVTRQRTPSSRSENTALPGRGCACCGTHRRLAVTLTNPPNLVLLSSRVLQPIAIPRADAHAARGRPGCRSPLRRGTWRW